MHNIKNIILTLHVCRLLKHCLGRLNFCAEWDEMKPVPIQKGALKTTNVVLAQRIVTFTFWHNNTSCLLLLSSSCRRYFLRCTAVFSSTFFVTSVAFFYFAFFLSVACKSIFRTTVFNQIIGSHDGSVAQTAWSLSLVFTLCAWSKGQKCEI